VQAWGKLVSAFGFLIVQVRKEHRSGEDESRYKLHRTFLDQNVETIAIHLKQFSLFVLYEIAIMYCIISVPSRFGQGNNALQKLKLSF
jgi:hypothetical protein